MVDGRIVIGAALKLPDLEKHRDWIIDKGRDVELQDFYRPDVLNSDWKPLVKKARELSRDFTGRLGIHGPFYDFGLAAWDPDIQAIVQKRLNQALEICEELEATHMVLHSPYDCWLHNNMDGRSGIRERILENCYTNMAKAVEKAEAIGCTIVMENISDIDPKDRLVMADSFNSDAVALSLDTGHAHFMHKSFGAPPVDYYVRSAGERLAHVHVHDVDGYADRHWAPGEGNIPWNAVFRALSQLDSRPRVVLELLNSDDIPKGFQWLEQQGLVQ